MRSPRTAIGRPEWRRLKAQILARDRYRCRWCGATTTHVVYLRPIAMGGSHAPGNVAACCDNCTPTRGATPNPVGNKTVEGRCRRSGGFRSPGVAL